MLCFKSKALLVSTCLVLGCTAGSSAANKGPEDDVPADGKLDSSTKNRDFGNVGLATGPFAGELDRNQTSQSFTFTLTDRAKLSITTGANVFATDDEVDTVLYLYKKTNGSWGPYLARNDDEEEGKLSSEINGTYGAGTYKVLVKGHSRSVTGPTLTSIYCQGAGCYGRTQTDSCLFGTEFPDPIEDTTGLKVLWTKALKASDVHGDIANQVLAAYYLRGSGGGEITAEEAFARLGGAATLRSVVEIDESGLFAEQGRYFEILETQDSGYEIGVGFVAGTDHVVMAYGPVDSGDPKQVNLCTVPTAAALKGLEGRVVDMAAGEFDPYIVGDNCLFTVEVEGGERAFEAGRYVFLDGLNNCESYNRIEENGEGAEVTIPFAGLQHIGGVLEKTLIGHGTEAKGFYVLGDQALVRLGH